MTFRWIASLGIALLLLILAWHCARYPRQEPDPNCSVFEIRGDELLTGRQGALAVLIVLAALTCLFTLMAVLDHFFPQGG